MNCSESLFPFPFFNFSQARHPDNAGRAKYAQSRVFLTPIHLPKPGLVLVQACQAFAADRDGAARLEGKLQAFTLGLLVCRSCVRSPESLS